MRAALRVEDDVSDSKDALHLEPNAGSVESKAESTETRARLEAERRRRASAAAAGDLAKAAKTLGEIEELRREGGGEGDDLAGVDVVERDARWLAEAARETRRRAGAALDAGIAGASQAEVGAALQVFHNLGELNAALAAQINLNHALDDGDSDSDWSD